MRVPPAEGASEARADVNERKTSLEIICFPSIYGHSDPLGQWSVSSFVDATKPLLSSNPASAGWCGDLQCKSVISVSGTVFSQLIAVTGYLSMFTWVNRLSESERPSTWKWKWKEESESGGTLASGLTGHWRGVVGRGCRAGGGRESRLVEREAPPLPLPLSRGDPLPTIPGRKRRALDSTRREGRSKERGPSERMSTTVHPGTSSSGFTSGGVLQDADILPELNGADLAMSLSPKHQPHTTPFSVTDILSPIEESYRKLELCAPPSPYRSSGGSSGGSTGPAASSPNTMANPYMHVHQFPSQYCNGSDITYGNSAAGWYGATANDPRFASECQCRECSIVVCRQR
ncbi:DNA binding [Homalodisca vitripennis]|nr:DNA binding [Homalodisca vitripennis]